MLVVCDTVNDLLVTNIRKIKKKREKIEFLFFYTQKNKQTKLFDGFILLFFKFDYSNFYLSDLEKTKGKHLTSF